MYNSVIFEERLEDILKCLDDNEIEGLKPDEGFKWIHMIDEVDSDKANRSKCLNQTRLLEHTIESSSRHTIFLIIAPKTKAGELEERMCRRFLEFQSGHNIGLWN